MIDWMELPFYRRTSMVTLIQPNS